MPVTIKRYQNRKLYNTQTRRYITLEELAELIKDEQGIKVIDNSTGRDITALTLSQIIYELEKQRSDFLPRKLLLSLVQAGGSRIDEIRQNIFNALSLFHHYDVEIETRINYLIERGELSQEEGNRWLNKLLAASHQLHSEGYTLEEKMTQYLQLRQVPTEDDFHQLNNKLDQLSQKLEEVRPKNAPI